MKLVVTPARALIDAPRTIRVIGAKPHDLVTVTARTLRSGGVEWMAQATFFTDANGNADLSTDAPVGGDYSVIDGMGLIWSQQPEGNGEPFADDVMQPLVTKLEAVDADGASASAELLQDFASKGVTRREIRENGLVGTLFTPAGQGPFPVVVVMNGSGGGINEPRAALYASHGYQAFALGYFKAPGLSPFITGTPLEYLEQGLRFAHALGPKDGFVAITGQSRGGELSLLLAATYPELVSAVMAYVPSAYVNGAQGAGDPDRDGWKGITWTKNSQPLTHFWQDNKAVHWHPWHGAVPPSRHHSVYFEGLKDRELAETSRIPVERANAPIALISGRDDRAWPSSLFSKIVQAKLEQEHYPHLVRHLDFDDAGHSINFPYVPTTQISRLHPVSKVPYSNGGTPYGNALANVGAWQGVLEFLKEIGPR